MSLHFESVAVEQICATEDFQISFHPEEGELPGVKEFGILQPILLFEDGTQLRLICGFRRVEASRREALAAIPAMVGRGWSPRLAILAALLERLGHGPLNSVEQARSIDRFGRHGWSRKELGGELLPLLGLKFNPMLLDQLAALLRLPTGIQRSVARGEIYLYTASRLAGWAPHETRIANWFAALKLGVNKQRELLDLMDDVALIGKLEKRGLLEDLEGIRSGNEPHQVYAAWLRQLKSMRYPRLSAAEQEFEKNKAGLHLPGQIQLTAPPFFEESRYRVNFAFSSREELRHYAEKLLSVCDTQELDAMMKLL